MENASRAAAHKSIDYNQLEKEKALQIQAGIATRLANQSLGKIDSLRHLVLSQIVKGDYEEAMGDLDRYVLIKAGFPSFEGRTESHIQHCKELINAIRAKRNFPGLAQMTMSKQQEMLDNVLGHFEELKQVLKYIERIAKDCALEDLRSTAWLLKTISYVIIAVVVTAFFLDFSEALGKPMLVIYDDFSKNMWDLISSALHL